MVRIFLVCSGLGRTRRGYEAFTQDLQGVLIDEPGLEVLLFKGGGKSSADAKALWNLPRRSRLAGLIGEWASLGNPLIGRGYYVEQLSFFVSLVPHLIVGRPDVVYFSDQDLGDFLWRWRRWTGQQFKLLFCNGGGYPPPLHRYDHVHQVTAEAYQQALAAASPSGQQTLIPLGFTIAPDFSPVTADQKAELRRRLGLPGDCFIVLSVSAVNTSQKRLDYLIQEIAALPPPRPYLVILGQIDAESPEVIRLANKVLGAEGFRVETVAPGDVGDYYRAADVFVLASTREGFGMALVEAMSHGLPCLAHDYGTARYVLGAEGYFADFTSPALLRKLIVQVLGENPDVEIQFARHRAVFERFAWDRLRPLYIEMIRRCASEVA
jgi:glycosyltransferase involved in cell wall biosynthesis